MVPAAFRSGRSLAAAAAAGGCLLAAGCGSSSPRGLTAGAETRLLAYVSDARADANGHDLSAVRSSLAGFIGYVGRLRGTGRVDAATAVRLDAEARAALQETITGKRVIADDRRRAAHTGQAAHRSSASHSATTSTTGTMTTGVPQSTP